MAKAWKCSKECALRVGTLLAGRGWARGYTPPLVFAVFPPLQLPAAAVTAAFPFAPQDFQQPIRDQELPRSAGVPLPFPITNAQCPLPGYPCLAICTVCIALRAEGAAGVRRRGQSRGQAQRPSLPPSTTSLSLSPYHPSKAAGGLHGRVHLPRPNAPWGRCFGAGQPLICTPEKSRN